MNQKFDQKVFKNSNFKAVVESAKPSKMIQNKVNALVDFHHNGRVELASMDDELPILIYIVLHSDVPNMLAEMRFIEDFIRLDQ